MSTSMSMASPIRLAILEADVPLTQTTAAYGSYGGVFNAFMHKGADAARLPKDRLQMKGWNVVDLGNGQEEGIVEEMGGQYDWKRTRGYPKMDEIDAILITGSRYNSFDDHPWILRLVEFTLLCIQSNRIRVIGVCFGHQIVGRALGAKVARSEGPTWEVSVCPVAQTPRGKAMFGGKDTLNIHQMHKDIVYHYPAGVEELGSTDACKVQGMYSPGKFITVQGHPEFTEEIVRELVEYRYKQNIFGEKVYQVGVANVGKEHDGVIVAQAFIKFLLEG